MMNNVDDTRKGTNVKWIFIVVCMTLCLFSCTDKKVNLINQVNDINNNMSHDNQDSHDETITMTDDNNEAEANIDTDDKNITQASSLENDEESNVGSSDVDMNENVGSHEISQATSTSNLSLGGMLATDLKWHYLSVHTPYEDGNSIRVRLKDDTKERLLGYPVRDLSINGDWIYYTVEYAHGIDNGIYRMKKDGSQSECIFKGNVSRLSIYNEKLYYLLKDDLSIYSLSLTGEESQNVLVGPISHYQLIDEMIYYYKGDAISSYDMITGESKVLGTYKPPFIVSGDYLYYFDKSTEADGVQSIKRMNVSANEEPEVVASDVKGNFFVVEDAIYYEKGALEEKELYRSNLDGTDTNKLLSSTLDLTIGSLMSVMDSYIYFTRSYDGEEHDLMRLDPEGNITEVTFD